MSCAVPFWQRIKKLPQVHTLSASSGGRRSFPLRRRPRHDDAETLGISTSKSVFARATHQNCFRKTWPLRHSQPKSAQCHPIRRWSVERESLFISDETQIGFAASVRDIIGIQMKNIIVAAVLAAIGSTTTLAADLGARAPYSKAPAMVAAVGNWS